MYKLKVIQNFTDLQFKVNRKINDEFSINDEHRVKELLGDNKLKRKLVKIIEVDNGKLNESKVLLYQDCLYKIGGIETFMYNFSKKFKDENITISSKQISDEQILRLSKYANFILDDNSMRYNYDVAILGNCSSESVIYRLNANKIYQMIHADWSEMVKLDMYHNYKWVKNPKIDEIICVSDTAKEGLKKQMGYDSKVIYNVLDDEVEKNPMRVFITLSRATKEKGIERVIEMAKRFKEEGKNFVWYLCCSLEQASPFIREEIKQIPEFVIVPPAYSNKNFIRKCDYLVQLSDTESFCYSAFEALQREVPVILTDFPEAKKIVDDGENGYLINMDLSNLDVDKIFNKVPQNIYYIDRCKTEDWKSVFKGEF